MADDRVRKALLRRGFALEYATLAWNAAGIVVLAIAAISARSVALAGFGGGALADDPSRRRKVAVGGYATTAVLSSAIGAAVAPWQAGVLRAAAWTARGLRGAARNALLADVVSTGGLRPGLRV